MAAELSDGQEVIVFTSEEDKEKWKQISANTFVGAGLIAQPSNGLININLADSQTLQKLPGIGPAKSQAIISYREQNGTFNNIQDLLKVSGIGDATFTNLEALVTVK